MSKDYNTANKITESLISEIKYLYAENVVGILATLVCHYSLPLNQETINGMKDAVADHFFDGLDPDWDDYGMWQWWEGMCPEWFEQLPALTLRCHKMPKDFKDTEND
jgi:hypothetical protein